eukprot:CAMPEP_0117680190 /NCGR_PEP_ID=MMETSP0804-20121206/18212_1 /TAXON_ID=1074897 /ORGANISM="Tetraselmis astigmatica, Strain CCMP880" /LENGTH=536 /DNA_ID=CAMNT_0005489655 /DNA_START=286 /DNA_END=1898 /DNA_ORIENTATION=+
MDNYWDGDVEGSLAESMALTRKLMANLQRVETAENEMAVRIALRAELAMRQEQVEAVKSLRGTGIRRFWKTTAPNSLSEQPSLKQSSMIVNEINRLHAEEARALISRMREEHSQIVAINKEERQRVAQGISKLALHQQTTVLKEVDSRRMAEETANRRKVQYRKVVRQRAQMLKRDRKFAQAFQRQHNVLNRQIVNAELKYRDIVADELKYDAVVHKKNEAVLSRKEMLIDVAASRVARKEETRKFRDKCAAAIAKNKVEKETIKHIVSPVITDSSLSCVLAQRREENRKGMSMVGPAGGTWGARRPETYRKVLNMTAVTSAVEQQERRASSTAGEEGGAQLDWQPSDGGTRAVASAGNHRTKQRLQRRQEHPSPRVPVHEEERDEPPKTIEIVASVPGMASDRSSTSLITSTSGTSHMLKMERSEAEWAAEIDELNAVLTEDDDQVDESFEVASEAQGVRCTISAVAAAPFGVAEASREDAGAGGLLAAPFRSSSHGNRHNLASEMYTEVRFSVKKGLWKFETCAAARGDPRWLI